MSKKPFPFSVCAQCCSGDVTPKQIQEAVDNYLKENPITETKEVHTVIVEEINNNLNIVKGSFAEIEEAYNNGAIVKLEVIVRHKDEVYLNHLALLHSNLLTNSDKFNFVCVNEKYITMFTWSIGNTIAKTDYSLITNEQFNTKLFDKADKETTYTKNEVDSKFSEFGNKLDNDLQKRFVNIPEFEDVMGDIDSALDELHNYAQAIITGGASE